MAEALRQVATGETGQVSDKEPSRKLLGDVLIEMKIISQAMLAKAIRHYDPERDGRLGDFLVAKKVINATGLQHALAFQSGKGMPAGSETVKGGHRVGQR